ncbi:hypothetical protein HMPREF0290_2782 [Corynebacterium efficiens YS-314]|uniref:site-specific DNA-methyltransferase (adenine-specific) n=1 Tax=Corynebacterium efficiens (strain DSM 44549 / YS-314 / AJ 12310 / JCM 11189 / NBRC 100395) TaxID=196164 RepID=Q8FSZ4_COREF|nr:DNA methyltransferase [Corynebacterium efficiens]EEW48586.1 hypothetical protein HMPREF0290_2782 [Corynebacterium efficiens YS-314]BAC19708.1 conserved hypothetical protein [Corynebacterium efficiens YS-314]
MATYDSIINVEEWISDHFLTTDETKGESYGKRVAQRVKEWKDDEADSGHTSPLTRFTSLRRELQNALATLDENTVDETTTLIRRALGYGQPTRRTFTRAGTTTEFDAWAGVAGSALLLVAEPIATLEDFPTTTVRGEVLVDAKPSSPTASALVGDIFLADTPPEFIVVIAGGWVILAERESWPLGRYLAIDLALVVERNDIKAKGEMQRVAVALARENVERAADGVTWWNETIEQSREHAIKVSGELRNAVRESIELIGNDVLNRYRDQGLSIDDIDGNELAKQSLRYLYRILFLLFAEASPELEILPTGTPEYDEGYGLSRLRELILTPPVTQNARSGTHLYDSLQILFHLVDQGNDPRDSRNPDFDPDAGEEGLQFRNLSADLFQPKATNIIDTVKLSNEALNTVLENLLLSKEQSGKERGFISYATLGVTELGQVYEGLMSYTGFIAEEDLFEVAKNGNPEKGSWVLPVAKADTVPQDSFVMQEVEANGGGVERQRRRHAQGSFVFRQSGRDRERSASFYTPQVLTEFTVSQAIEVLQETGRIKKAEDVLDLTVCEPAMGSGAFAVEAVRQLAELYVTLRQEELGEQIPAEDRTRELQKIKAHIALHQVYGVDLNATAVELAEISLWLDTMTADLKAPWFGLHLRRGNSLIGATRSVYSPRLLSKKAWLKEVPTRLPLVDVAESVDSGSPESSLSPGIHHFLLPSAGWGATADAKDVKDIASEEQKVLKAWRRSIQVVPDKNQKKLLEGLSRRVEKLWRLALIRLRIAEDQARRDIDVWGHETQLSDRVITREQIERDLFDNPNNAYNRLRLAMDAWCALWFWPLDQVRTEEHPDRPELPDFDEWLATLRDILGIETSVAQGQYVLGAATTWEELNEFEEQDAKLSGARDIKFVNGVTWLTTARDVATTQGYFHWDLDFAAVFARGGFDLQVGNPPWVRPDVKVDDLLAEVDPWFCLASKPTQADKKLRTTEVMKNPGSVSLLLRGTGETVATAAVLGSVPDYPHLKDQRPDLYRGFMETTWSNASSTGVVSLIHPESHFTEKKAAPLRREVYLRLRRHWQFINALMLFDIDDHVVYGVHLYSSKQDSPQFHNATKMYHPETAAQSVHHNGDGPLPGIKDEDYNWDRRPHRDRIQHVDESVLKTWKSVLEDDDIPWLDTRMVYTVNTEAAAVLEKLAAAPRMKDLDLQFSSGWNETTDKKKGYFDVGWGHPDSWDDVILQGPHLGVSTPMIKQPNPTMKHNQDWTEIDLEALPADFIPATAYQPNYEMAYNEEYAKWKIGDQNVSSASVYRIAWRKMAATTGFRTLYPTIIPPGATHVDGIISGASTDIWKTIAVGATASSFLSDFLIRAMGVQNIHGAKFALLPIAITSKYMDLAIDRYLSLNCLTSAYATLWRDIEGEEWTVKIPIHNAKERFHAQNEIDALVALSLGITADELCMIYRTQFPVMRRYDQENRFDSLGRKISKEVLKNHLNAGKEESLTTIERTWEHPQSGVSYTFEYPFSTLNREADLRRAYAEFSAT